MEIKIEDTALRPLSMRRDLHPILLILLLTRLTRPCAVGLIDASYRCCVNKRVAGRIRDVHDMMARQVKRRSLRRDWLDDTSRIDALAERTS